MDDRACLTGSIFVLKSGIPWQMLPQELGCGSGMTCWRRLRDWQAAGVWERLHRVLLDELGRADVLQRRAPVVLGALSHRCISLLLYPPSGSETPLFNQMFPGEGGTAPNIFEVPESGMYFIDSQNTMGDADWIVTFEKR